VGGSGISTKIGVAKEVGVLSASPMTLLIADCKNSVAKKWKK
jgi:hypothetical protein